MLLRVCVYVNALSLFLTLFLSAFYMCVLWSLCSECMFVFPTASSSAMYGMMHITGDEGGGPVKPGVAVTDVLTGDERL